MHEHGSAAGQLMGPGVLNSMLGRTCPWISCASLCQLSCTRTVSHITLLLRANCRGMVPLLRAIKTITTRLCQALQSLVILYLHILLYPAACWKPCLNGLETCLRACQSCGRHQTTLGLFTSFMKAFAAVRMAEKHISAVQLLCLPSGSAHIFII